MEETKLRHEFNEVYVAAHDQTVGLLICKGSTYEEAEDAFQMACLRLWEYYLGVRGKGSYNGSKGQGQYSVEYLGPMLQRMAVQRDIEQKRKPHRSKEEVMPEWDIAFSTDGIDELVERLSPLETETLFSRMEKLGYSLFSMRMLRLYYKFGSPRMARRMHTSYVHLYWLMSQLRADPSFKLPDSWLKPFRRMLWKKLSN